MENDGNISYIKIMGMKMKGITCFSSVAPITTTCVSWRRFLKRRMPELRTTRSFHCILCAKWLMPRGALGTPPDQLRVRPEGFEPKESWDLVAACITGPTTSSLVSQYHTVSKPGGIVCRILKMGDDERNTFKQQKQNI